ncbi:glycosyltransferase family 2 protein [Dyella acidiphila]|uniref:Glycosyltransferase family 2 protein n=1 Tax=Dyella acidiphila TaxID=2775866 RepID=A0ABR9G557_9GAMM|nr:glycosyltransferase family 2 protein [Dyella acidiphila]MBE1159148.1 glycosyltransferase family 2 protein [Dyella acidiphila]
MTNKKPLISISIPVLNEESNLDTLYARLCALAERMADRCELEFVFTDNHSEDRTWAIIRGLAASDSRVRAIRFSRNFGFQNSILANYLHTRGDAVMQVDADLQDPPELLEQFFELWQQGYKVVYGIRRKRPESALLNMFRKCGYWFIDKISEHSIPRDVGDFRLVDRAVINALARTRSATPYLRGMIAGMGFEQTGIVYDRDARTGGESKFNVVRLLRLGLTAVFNHSAVPLRLATYVGVLILFLSGAAAIYYVGLRLIDPNLPRGFTSIQLLLLFGIGLNAFLLGIIGEYILRIYRTLRADPIAIVEQSLNIEPGDLKL